MSKKFFDTLPQEILDSRLFKFEVVLPSVYEHFCPACHIVFDTSTIQCPQCNTNQLVSRNRTILVDIAANVGLDYDNVERSLDDIPSQFAFWTAVYAEAKYRTNILERVVKTARATAHDEVIQAAMKEGTRLAQDSIKILVEKDERVNRAEGMLAQANMIAAKLYYMHEAVKMKADLGRTLTSLKRSESNGS